MIVCAGSGGVGKTTVSCTLAVRAAMHGKRVLALTVDPSRRLATALGIDKSSTVESRVSLPDASGELWACVIDSKLIFDQFIASHSASPEMAARILRNRLYQQLSTTLSGSQEFTSLERLLQAYECKKFDLIILDTPPTKHAVDFLTAPARIEALFQDSITKWFSGTGESTGLVGGFIGHWIDRGAKVALRSLEILTGGQFIEELIDFFNGIRSVQKTLRERSIQTRELLTANTTKFCLVTGFSGAKLIEAKYLNSELKKMGYSLGAVVINRAFPVWLKKTGIESSEISPAVIKLKREWDNFLRFHAERFQLFNELTDSLDSDVCLFRIPEYEQDVFGLADLVRLANSFKLLDKADHQ